MARQRKTKTKTRKTGLTLTLAHMQTRHVAALYRIAKTRCRPFFRHPNAMMELREELAKRG